MEKEGGGNGEERGREWRRKGEGMEKEGEWMEKEGGGGVEKEGGGVEEKGSEWKRRGRDGGGRLDRRKKTECLRTFSKIESWQKMMLKKMRRVIHHRYN